MRFLMSLVSLELGSKNPRSNVILHLMLLFPAREIRIVSREHASRRAALLVSTAFGLTRRQEVESEIRLDRIDGIFQPEVGSNANGMQALRLDRNRSRGFSPREALAELTTSVVEHNMQVKQIYS